MSSIKYQAFCPNSTKSQCVNQLLHTFTIVKTHAGALKLLHMAVRTDRQTDIHGDAKSKNLANILMSVSSTLCAVFFSLVSDQVNA